MNPVDVAIATPDSLLRFRREGQLNPPHFFLFFVSDLRGNDSDVEGRP